MRKKLLLIGALAFVAALNVHAGADFRILSNEEAIEGLTALHKEELQDPTVTGEAKLKSNARYWGDMAAFTTVKMVKNGTGTTDPAGVIAFEFSKASELGYTGSALQRFSSIFDAEYIQQLSILKAQSDEGEDEATTVEQSPKDDLTRAEENLERAWQNLATGQRNKLRRDERNWIRYKDNLSTSNRIEEVNKRAIYLWSLH